MPERPPPRSLLLGALARVVIALAIVVEIAWCGGLVYIGARALFGL